MGVAMTNKRMFVLAVALGFIGGFAWVAIARDVGAPTEPAVAVYAGAD